MATINDLSDAILSEIFSYIGLIERQRLEIVCKRWRGLIRVLWSKISKLWFDMICDDGIVFAWVPRQKSLEPGFEAATISEIGAILKICENNLTQLRIFDRGPDDDVTDEFEPLRNCKNLKSFVIDTYDNNLIISFLNYMPTESLEELQVHKIQHEFTEEVVEIIEGSIANKDDSFFYMPISVWIKILMKVEQLTSFGLSGVSSKILTMIGKMSQLKCLYLGNLNNSIESADLSLDFTRLTNLEDLEICEERMVDNQLVIQIAENCKKLRRVKLWSENSISVGLEALEKLPNLRIVDLMVPVCIEVLNYFSNLEEFYCDLKDYHLMNEETLIKFLKRSPNLKKYFLTFMIIMFYLMELQRNLGRK